MLARILMVIGGLAILLLLGLFARRAYCNSAVSYSRVERDGAISERQSLLCSSFSRAP
jgi:hypothetical protein